MRRWRWCVRSSPWHRRSRLLLRRLVLKHHVQHDRHNAEDRRRRQYLEQHNLPLFTVTVPHDALSIQTLRGITARVKGVDVQVPLTTPSGRGSESLRRFPGLWPSRAQSKRFFQQVSNAAPAHRDHVFHQHRLFHHERLAILGADQVAVEPCDGAQALADLLLVGK